MNISGRLRMYLYGFLVFQILLLSGCDLAGDPKENTLTLKELSDQFKEPPSDARPGAFWCWLNGNISRERISRDLREMSDKGMSRAEIWDVAAIRNQDNYIPAGPAFMSDSSVAMIKYTFSEAEKYGIKIGMVGSSGWNAGGTWVEPDWASKALYYSELTLEGPLDEPVKLPFPLVPEACPKNNDGMPVFFREVAVLALPQSKDRNIENTTDIIDLSSQFDGDYLNAELPEGDWMILRFICSNNGQKLIVPSPNSGGLFIDFLDPQSTIRHLSHFINRLGISKEGNDDGGLSYIEFDSMELAEGVAWTDSMPDIFKERRGYDIIKYLPALAGWSITDETERFLYDWTKTLSDQLIFSHYETGRKFLEEYDIDLVAEAGGPGPPIWNTCPVDALKALGSVSIPRGEFWIRHRNMFLIKEVASAAHIYGKKLVDAESFTTWRRWKDSPYVLKTIVDRAFCEGLNYVTFHTFASTAPEDGLPGRTYHAGSDINHANTWWEKSGPFMDYLARSSYMLQQGMFVADACYFYGDQAPNFYPAYHDVPVKPVPESLGTGYDYDVVNSDVILNRMSVNDRRIVLPDGLSYSVLVLPDQTDMPLDVLRKLEEMVQQGATIIGKKPLTVPGLNMYNQENKELSAISDRLWAGIDGEKVKVNNYGEGRVIYNMTAREVLLGDGIERDFIHDGEQALDYIHRQTDDYDIYFIRNKTSSTYSGDCSFRTGNRYPELWDPSTGTQVRPEKFSGSNGRVDLNLDLEPGASVFVVFTKEKRAVPVNNNYTAGAEKKIISIDKNWKLTFPEGWGAPAEISVQGLKSWTDFDDEGIKYFSGTATYTKTVEVSDENIGEDVRAWIDLGKVYDVAEVFVNGQSAGVLWKEPYQLDITGLLKQGKNEFQIEVVNQWINRLTGDMQLDPRDRYCRTNQPYITSDMEENSDETFRIQTAGLLGPAKLIFWE